MILSRDAMNAICNFPKMDVTTLAPETQKAIEFQLRTVWDTLPQITRIEGVTNLAGAMYNLEKSIIDTLETLGSPIAEIEKAERHASKFLTLEKLFTK